MSEIVKGRVGERAEHLITNIRDEQGSLAIGNVVRRACEWARLQEDFDDTACKEECQLRRILEERGGDTGIRAEFIEAGEQKQCADANVSSVLESLRMLEGKRVLIVGVTANGVGFADKLDEYDEEGKLKDVTVSQNSYQSFGWKELPGFNAFFAREGEVDALGRRLADCADENFEFKDSDGNTVIGFVHGTRTNMFGESEYRFDRNGKKVSYTEYALGQAIDHYGADPASIKIKLAAAIKGHNFIKHFDTVYAMENHARGWLQAGFLKNISNLEWVAGENGEISIEDAWEADTRAMIVHDIEAAMKSLGIPEDNFNMEGIIDPADSKGKHSSHEFEDEYGDTRDLYLTYIPQTNG